MASLLAVRRALIGLRRRNAGVSLFATCNITKSPSDSNILRILRHEADYQSEYAPPQKPAAKFNSFVVQDRPGEQWMTMRGKFGSTEEIKLEVTMFDGFERVIKSGNDDDDDDGTVEDVRLHISVLVDVLKKDGSDVLEFVCSAWPECLEIQKVYVRDRDKNERGIPYLGPNFRNLSRRLQTHFREFLEERGVNDQLSVFLHEYMMNKDRIELVQWFRKVESFVER